MRVGLPGSVSGGSGASRAWGTEPPNKGDKGAMRQGSSKHSRTSNGHGEETRKAMGDCGFYSYHVRHFCASDDPDQHRTTRLPISLLHSAQ